MVRVQPDLTYEQEERYYLAYLARYFAIAPRLEELGKTFVLEMLNACNRQVKYQCSLMASQPVVV